MSLKITIFDGAIPMLDKIAEAHYGQALDALDYAGTKLRKATRREFRASTTNFRQFYKNGKWVSLRTKQNNKLGKRISHVRKGGKDKTQSMESFITSNLMAKSLTMVVAGKHGRLKPLRRRDGKVVGSEASVGAVTKGSYAILKKLNDGDDSGSDYKKVRRTEKQAKFFRDVKFKKQSFIEKGRSAAMGEVRQIMTTKFEQLLQKQIDRVNVKVRKVQTA